jgi:hypothetical protein
MAQENVAQFHHFKAISRVATLLEAGLYGQPNYVQTERELSCTVFIQKYKNYLSKRL